MMISLSYCSSVCSIKFGDALNVIQSDTHYHFFPGLKDMNDGAALRMEKKRKTRDHNVEVVGASGLLVSVVRSRTPETVSN